MATAACLDIIVAMPLQAEPCALPSAGDRWSIDQPEANLRREVQVAGRSRVTVPAGGFDAIELVVVNRLLAAPAGADASVPRARIRLWYAPEVRAIARAEREFLRADGTVQARQVDVLESFVHAGVRTPAQDAPVTAVMTPPAPDTVRHATFVPSPGCTPKYPPAAMSAQVMGVTRVRFSIDANGRVVNGEIIHSSGPTREHRLLDRAAIDGLGACRFIPPTGPNGQPVGSTVELTYTWKLD